jgi:heptosyltransferase-1
MRGTRILVVKMSSMGDIVHAQPLVSDVLTHCPDACIDWVCEAPFAAIAEMNPGINQVIPIAWRKWRKRLHDPANRTALIEFVKKLRATQYDWVIDCQGLIKSAAVSRLARAAHRAGHAWHSAREPLASLAYDRRVSVERSLHVVMRNRLVAAGALGYEVNTQARFGLKARRFSPDWVPIDRPRAVLIPGASRPEKLWPESHWIEVGKRLASSGRDVVWFWGSPSERDRAMRLAAACGPVIDAGADTQAAEGICPFGESSTEVKASQSVGIIPPFLSVADCAGLLESADIVVGLDTGFTHLAGALGRPTVGIFCDFDATQCAVSGDAPCESFGGIGQVPAVSDIQAAIDRLLGSALLASSARSSNA